MAFARVAEKRMGLPEIRTKALALGLTPGKTRKAELIHAIQMAEGHNPCFGRSNADCRYTDCCFMPDCLKSKS
jgi:hypothetical protein